MNFRTRVRTLANQALRANEREQGKLIDQARALREFLLTLGRTPRRRRRRGRKGKLRIVRSQGLTRSRKP